MRVATRVARRRDLGWIFGRVARTLAVVAVFLPPCLFHAPSVFAVTWPLEPRYIERPSAGIDPKPHEQPPYQIKSIDDIAFVLIPAGCFNMGNFQVGIVGEVCFDAFYISQHEVTNAQFRRFRSTHDSGTHEGQSLNGAQQPVVNVTWSDAMAFASWLGDSTGEAVRLPTEAEWEYACWAGQSEVPEDRLGRYANLRSGAAGKSGTNLDVGSLEPNPFGLHDMQGNASEWVYDSYVEDPNRFGPNRVNPFVDLNGNPLRVRRGGSWSSTAAQSHCSARDYYVSELAVPHTGFRIVQAKPLQ